MSGRIASIAVCKDRSFLPILPAIDLGTGTGVASLFWGHARVRTASTCDRNVSKTTSRVTRN